VKKRKKKLSSIHGLCEISAHPELQYLTFSLTTLLSFYTASNTLAFGEGFIKSLKNEISESKNYKTRFNTFKERKR
jgi:hypothetical protein